MTKDEADHAAAVLKRVMGFWGQALDTSGPLDGRDAAALEAMFIYSNERIDAEREACAKACDQVEQRQDDDHGAANTGGAAASAAAIRARSDRVDNEEQPK